MTTQPLPQPLPEVIAGIPFTRAERALVEALGSGEVVSLGALQATTGTAAGPTSNVQQVLMSRIRKKLEAADAPLRIATVRGQGYRLLSKKAGAA